MGGRYANCDYSLLSLHHILASSSEVHCGKRNGLGREERREYKLINVKVLWLKLIHDG